MTTTTAVHSNAFNFMSFIQSQVDPRTGQYTCAVALPELKVNDLNGPVIPLQLSFNPLNNNDSGFGKGWNLQLSQFNPVTGIVSLYTGETFKVDLGPSVPDIPEQKIDSFHFSTSSSGGVINYRIEHKSGLVEILEKRQGQLALPVKMISPQGHVATFEYKAFGTEPLLSSIIDEQGLHLLELERTTNVLQVVQHPGTPYKALYTLNIANGETRSIVLPTHDLASWRFEYEPQDGLTCLKRVVTPTGGIETVTYSGTPHYLPGSTGRSLPRVALHKRDPGFAQPPIITRYTYDTAGYNFLGYGSNIKWGDDGLDNLYKVAADYTYETTETLRDASDQRDIRSTRRVFNRFHLLIREETLQKAQVASDDDTLLVTESVYHITPDVPFKDQPRFCQLPKSVTRTWRNNSRTTPNYSETVSTTYDDFGNLLTQVDANGVTTTNEWYKAEGETGCPQDPQGFVRNLKSTTVTPASTGAAGAPVLKTRYRYGEFSGMKGSSPWLAVQDETLYQVAASQESELQRTVFAYYETPAEPFTHGRKQREELTLNQHTTRTDFVYSKTVNTHAGGETVLNTFSTLTGFDDASKAITLQHSLMSGEPLLNRDDNDVEIAYEYDLLRRVTKETVAPGTEYEASRTYSYSLTNDDKQQARQSAIDVKGVETISYLDGHNRVLKETRCDADALGGNKDAYRETYLASYNEREELVSETVIDWEDARDVKLTSHLRYDDWGQQRSVVRPDGVEEHDVTDPIARTTSQWTEGMGKTVTYNNRFDKPEKVVRTDLAGASLGEHVYSYDGLGRTASERDAVGNLTRYEYDAYDRMLISELPDGFKVERAYAPHSSEDLPVKISVGGRVLGEQTFDGLDRMTTSVTGGRTSTYHFEKGQRQPKEVVRPNGSTTTYDYRLELGEDPVQRKVIGSDAHYEYDPLSARLSSTRETGEDNKEHRLFREYFSTGEVKSERRESDGEAEHVMHYHYSRQARLLSYTDVLHQTQTYVYDAYARLKSTALGSTSSAFSYNPLGQLKSIETIDGAQRLQISLQYDDFGREVLRTFELGAGVTQTLAQVYDNVDRLIQRTLQQGAQIIRDETYGYDARGRLEIYDCAGEQPPVDPYGKPVRNQSFGFDEMDNITFVMTTFEEAVHAPLRMADLRKAVLGGAYVPTEDSNVAIYEYDNADDPCQLTGLTNSHADYPSELKFSYDDDGNLLVDEAGRSLAYDSLGRLLSVSAAQVS